VSEYSYSQSLLYKRRIIIEQVGNRRSIPWPQLINTCILNAIDTLKGHPQLKEYTSILTDRLSPLLKNGFGAGVFVAMREDVGTPQLFKLLGLNPYRVYIVQRRSNWRVGS
jgi:hypothetical protein